MSDVIQAFQLDSSGGYINAELGSDVMYDISLGHCLLGSMIGLILALLSAICFLLMCARTLGLNYRTSYYSQSVVVAKPTNTAPPTRTTTKKMKSEKPIPAEESRPLLKGT
eukprot:GHVH01011992.1.p1 GENE.GHVH01011992.1~~GHVH01011992.1.p1  ORF type:complete len:111 (+),score=4.98 GHVH01011992.1:14-346(+)